MFPKYSKFNPEYPQFTLAENEYPQCMSFSLIVVLNTQFLS
nr:MAG TPA: hypothetical protein [Caudoviricetes sp.]